MHNVSAKSANVAFSSSKTGFTRNPLPRPEDGEVATNLVCITVLEP